jgi:hypothetical protein
VLRVSQSTSRFADLLAQFLQIAGNAGFHRIGKIAGTQPIAATLHAGSEVIFLQTLQCAAEPVGGRRLSRSQFACGIAKLLRKMRQIVGYLLTIVRHLVEIAGGRRLRISSGGVRGSLLR